MFAPTFAGLDPVRLDDVTADPRYGRNPPHRGMPEGHLPVRSYLAVPVVSRTQEVIGGLFLGHPDVAVFTERVERIVVGIASHAAVAIDNARLYDQRIKLIEELREADRRKDDFLAMLGHELRNPLAAIRSATELIRLTEADDPRVRRVHEILDRQTAQVVGLLTKPVDIAALDAALGCLVASKP